jgi:ABC-type transport system involved in cytochrome bd biosynthesis fused ATPase/permease subunit
MSILSTIKSDLATVEADGVKVGDFITRIVSDAATLDNAFLQLSPSFKAVLAGVMKDAVAIVSSGSAVATAAETGNVTGAATLSVGTISLVQQLIADAKAGSKTLIADFKALNIKL